MKELIQWSKTLKKLYLCTFKIKIAVFDKTRIWIEKIEKNKRQKFMLLVLKSLNLDATSFPIKISTEVKKIKKNTNFKKKKLSEKYI